MTTPIVFDVQGSDIRFGATAENVPYAVASDYAKAMGYLQASDATRLLDDDEKGQQIVLTPGGPQQMNVIYEDGMWELIFRSSLPGAKAIKARVKAILKQIRETGSYFVEQPAQAPALPQDYEEALVALLGQVRENRALTGKVAELEPMAAQAAHYRSAEGLIAVGDFANDLKGWAARNVGVPVLHPQVWDFLGEIGLLIRGNTLRHNEPTAFAVQHDYVRARKTEFETKTRGLQASSTPRLTPKGAGYAWDKALRRLMEHNGLGKDDGRNDGHLGVEGGRAALRMLDGGESA